MGDDNNPNGNRPIDPTRSGEDLIGDTTGMTGITTGSAGQTGATPNDDIKAQKEHLPGIQSKEPTTHPTEAASISSQTDADYRVDTQKGMSDVTIDRVNDIAEEPDQTTPSINSSHDTVRSTTPLVSDTNEKDPDDNKTDATNAFNVGDTTGFTHDNSPSFIGEQSVSGTNPDPSSDDDTLANAQSVGTQLNEDSENPQEIDIARDTDQAEEDIRTH